MSGQPQETPPSTQETPPTEVYVKAAVAGGATQVASYLASKPGFNELQAQIAAANPWATPQQVHQEAIRQQWHGFATALVQGAWNGFWTTWSS